MCVCWARCCSKYGSVSAFRHSSHACEECTDTAKETGKCDVCDVRSHAQLCRIVELRVMHARHPTCSGWLRLPLWPRSIVSRSHHFGRLAGKWRLRSSLRRYSTCARCQSYHIISCQPRNTLNCPGNPDDGTVCPVHRAYRRETRRERGS